MWKALKKKLSAIAAPFKKLKAKYKGRQEAAKLDKLQKDFEEAEEALKLQRQKSVASFKEILKLANAAAEAEEIEEMESYSDRILAQEKLARDQMQARRQKEKELADCIAACEALIKTLDD